MQPLPASGLSRILDVRALQRRQLTQLSRMSCGLSLMFSASTDIFSKTFQEPAGQCSAAFAGVRAALSQRPRLAALPFAANLQRGEMSKVSVDRQWCLVSFPEALLLMGYNYAWLLSASFIDLRLTNAVFQVSTASRMSVVYGIRCNIVKSECSISALTTS